MWSGKLTSSTSPELMTGTLSHKPNKTKNSLHAGKFFMLMLLSADFFSKISFRNTIRVSNGLDPDQNRHSVCPGLDVIKLFSCSTQLSMKLIRHANVNIC